MSLVIEPGTDGWPGIIAGDFTSDNVQCGAVLRVCPNISGTFRLTQRGPIIGYDNCFASEHPAAAATEVIAANGINGGAPFWISCFWG